MNIRHRETQQILLEIKDDLTGMRLDGVNLSYADLRAKKLEQIVLLGVDLSYSDLTYAELSFASTYNTNFSYANLTESTLCEATLAEANLSYTNLSGAALQFTNLTGTNFKQANLTGTTLNGTLFVDCQNLHKATGLADVEHEGPSILDLRTLRSSVLYLPDNFLIGVGYTPREIESLRNFYSQMFH